MNKKGLAPAKGGKGLDLAALAAQYKISQEDVAMYKQSFDLFDTDQGGSVDTKGTQSFTSELKAAMVSLGFESKNATIFQMISDLDEDGSGQL